MTVRLTRSGGPDAELAGRVAALVPTVAAPRIPRALAPGAAQSPHVAPGPDDGA